MKKMIDNEKAMKLLQVADKVDFESDEMVIEGKLDVNGKITANNGVELAEGTILTVPSASNVFIKDESTNLDQELYAKQDKLVSGTNIKTINGNSVLGSGNLTINSGTKYTAGENIYISSENVISWDNIITISSSDTVSTEYLDTTGKKQNNGAVPGQFMCFYPTLISFTFGSGKSLSFVVPNMYFQIMFTAGVEDAVYQITGSKASYSQSVETLKTYWGSLSTIQRRTLLYNLFTFRKYGCLYNYGVLENEGFIGGSDIISVDPDTYEAYAIVNGAVTSVMTEIANNDTLTAITMVPLVKSS